MVMMISCVEDDDDFLCCRIIMWRITHTHTHTHIYACITKIMILFKSGRIGRSYRIHRLLLCKGVRPLSNECLVYDAKRSDSEVPVMMEIWGMRSTPLLTSLPGPLMPGAVASDRVLSIGQIELNCILMLNWIVCNKTALTFNCV